MSPSVRLRCCCKTRLAYLESFVDPKTEPEFDFRSRPNQSAAALVEARVGIEPTYKGFADLSLTTWVPRQFRTSNAVAADLAEPFTAETNLAGGCGGRLPARITSSTAENGSTQISTKAYDSRPIRLSSCDITTRQRPRIGSVAPPSKPQLQSP